MNSLRTSGEYERIMLGVYVVCGLGFASAVVPWVEMLVGQVLVVLAVAGLLAYVMWWVQRWLREYREDRADVAHVNAVLTAHARTEQRARVGSSVGGDR